jgi:sugar phosphate isomerase/epimerase
MLDTRAMSHMTGGPLPLIARFGQGAGHYHANNPDGKGPGMSAFDYRPILAALREARYLGWVSVEPFDDQPDARTVCLTALQTLRAAGAALENARSR